MNYHFQNCDTRKFDWTGEAVETLKRLWAEGWSASRIAEELTVHGDGPTRSAVLGKINRLGLPLRKTQVNQHSGKRDRRGDNTRARHLSRRKPTFRAMLLPDRPSCEPEPLLLPLDELSDRTCRWPIGDPRAPGFGFCGHECRPELPYCEYHTGRAWLADAGLPLRQRREAPCT